MEGLLKTEELVEGRVYQFMGDEQNGKLDIKPWNCLILCGPIEMDKYKEFCISENHPRVQDNGFYKQTKIYSYDYWREVPPGVEAWVKDCAKHKVVRRKNRPKWKYREEPVYEAELNEFYPIY